MPERREDVSAANVELKLHDSPTCPEGTPVAVGTAGIRKSGKVDRIAGICSQKSSDLLAVRELPLVESSCAASAAFCQRVVEAVFPTAANFWRKIPENRAGKLSRLNCGFE
jgi:hypothetical protein